MCMSFEKSPFCGCPSESFLWTSIGSRSESFLWLSFKQSPLCKSDSESLMWMSFKICGCHSNITTSKITSDALITSDIKHTLCGCRSKYKDVVQTESLMWMSCKRKSLM